VNPAGTTSGIAAWEMEARLSPNKFVGMDFVDDDRESKSAVTDVDCPNPAMHPAQIISTVTITLVRKKLQRVSTVDVLEGAGGAAFYSQYRPV
jgi:hypothetical protein